MTRALDLLASPALKHLRENTLLFATVGRRADP